MKKIDKKIFLNVVLGILMMSIFTSLISCFNNGFSNIIIKGDPLYSSFYILTGVFLNIPVVLFILGFLDKDKKIKFISPILNLSTIVIIMIFAIVLASTGWAGSAGIIFITVGELILKFFIVDYDDFVTIIRGVKTAAKESEKAAELKKIETAEVDSSDKKDSQESTEVAAEEAAPVDEKAAE